MNTENTFSRWFGRVMWAGIAANLVIAVIALFHPAWLISKLGLPAASPPVWPRLVAFLLILLSAFYVPATQPLRSRTAAMLAVVSRFAGVTFFALVVLRGNPATYLIFAVFDLCFGLPQAILLYRAVKQEQGRYPALPWVLRPWYVWSALPLLVLLPWYGAWFYLFREQPVRTASAEEHFKYGSIGTEFDSGMPYWIWLVLPRVFPEKLPAAGGYTSLGMLWEYGQELPVGFTKQTIGFPRVGLNCAACHTSSYRKSEDEATPTIVTGGAGQAFDAQGYLRFLFACASDSRFTADVLLPQIEREYPLSFVERHLYRYLLIPMTRKALLKQKESYVWMDSRPAWGRGRVDPFNPVKFGTLGQPMDGTVGNSDMPPLWSLKDRPGRAYHWDGLNPSLREVVVSSAIGDGAPPKVINRPDVQENLKRVEAFLQQLSSPAWPFALDEPLKEQGRSVYTEHCASCHGTEGQGTDRIIPAAEVGTDSHRMEMWTPQAAQAYNQYTSGYAWALSSFRKEPGYLAAPLKGLWLRAPYLHNGSVPTLKDLLEPVSNRPTAFFRGNDVYDPERVGFVTDRPRVVRGGVAFPLFRYDTAVPGNGNQGHLYGVELPPDAKRALLEFLKSL
ncbi:c-type cytochrome [Hyalangium gracile]|uniref:c-type cytochrome n=1 Tax=Hyalangium gracile TaxID=394092 RepID=UPI001CC92221|nr:cytochrome c [Hyalangium gracile]